MLQTTATFKIDFFDARPALRAAEKAKRRNLSKAGAYIRQAQRQLIRRRKRPAPAGSPPSLHTTDKIRSPKNIRFAYDWLTKSVVVGMVGLPSPGQGDPLPGVFELGGRRISRVKPVAGTRRGAGRTKKRVIKLKARPSVIPAAQSQIKRTPDLFKDSIRP
jgi:hypothetical protein